MQCHRCLRAITDINRQAASVPPLPSGNDLPLQAAETSMYKAGFDASGFAISCMITLVFVVYDTLLLVLLSYS